MTWWTGAAYLFCNEYEATLTERKTGWTGGEIVEHVGVRVTTLGAAGARVDRAGENRRLSSGRCRASCRRSRPAPGDAFRSGFLAAVAWGLPPGARGPARQPDRRARAGDGRHRRSTS